MADTEEYKFHDVQKCKLCGDCLSKCPEMSLPLETARREKAKINRGEMSDNVSRSCTSCFDCDDYCPNDAAPCETIMDHWGREYKERGLLERARYFLPMQKLNFRSYILERLPADEKEMVAKWDDKSPCSEFIYPGCNVTTVPYLTKTSLLPPIPIRGGLDWCCSETFFRMGYYDLAAIQGKKMQARFADMGAREILMMCTAGTFCFTKMLPERLNIKFDAKFKPLVRYLWEQLESGQIKVVNKLQLRATVQDSCYAKFLEPDYLMLPRKILERIGVEVVEMPRSKERMVCCGIGAGFSMRSNYNTARITLSTLKRINEARKTGADLLCVYCAGCMQMLGSGSLFYPNAPQIYHLLELVQLAAGEQPLRRISSRVKTMFAGVARHQMPKLLSNKRFQPEREF